MKEWLTVKEAAYVVNRHERNIYRWIEKGILAARTSEDGTLEVKAEDATRVESITRRGRPRGVPNRHAATR